MESFPHGKTLPMNSKRLTVAHLRQVAEALGLPTSGSADQIRQLIEGKLEGEDDRDVANVQVIIQESPQVQIKLSLVDGDGVFLETSPTIKTVEKTESALTRELSEATRQNEALREELASALQLWEDEKKEVAVLREKLASCEESEAHVSKITRLKTELKMAKEKSKQMWTISCSQSREQEELLAEKDEELARLRSELHTRRSCSPSSPRDPSPGGLSHHSTPVSEPSPVTVPTTRTARRGKAPPVDPFTGENPEVRLDDWLPSLQRAATWNGWSEEEQVIQLAGHLRGRALQEWNLMRESDRCRFESAVSALRTRLDPGSKAMAAQEFRHTSQKDNEGVSDFIRRLERVFRVAYGRDGLLSETRDALLYSQLQEGLKLSLMEGPAVSGASDYKSLCIAAKNEERRQAALKQRKQYNSERAPKKSNPGGGETTPKPSDEQKSGNDTPRTRNCWNCGEPGHVAANCRRSKRESSGSSRFARKNTSANVEMVTAPVVEDDPLQYLLSDDSDDSSKPQRVRVTVQGVPMDGIVDSAADITIMNGEMFKQVAAVAKLRKKRFQTIRSIST
jgi:hypothetical protein